PEPQFEEGDRVWWTDSRTGQRYIVRIAEETWDGDQQSFMYTLTYGGRSVNGGDAVLEEELDAA
ncbi:MAG: hypothetical protein M1827_002157, partial [Pycnora praestabilis]